jgi:hypothetical protein
VSSHLLRTATWAVLVAAYAVVLFGADRAGPARLDPVGPAARQIELALADGRFADALPMALDVQRAHMSEPLVAYWLALIYRGLGRPDDEALAWDAFAATAGDSQAICAIIMAAYPDTWDAVRSHAWRGHCDRPAVAGAIGP